MKGNWEEDRAAHGGLLHMMICGDPGKFDLSGNSLLRQRRGGKFCSHF